MNSQHVSSSSMLAGINQDHLRANLIKMIRDGERGKKPFNTHNIELNAYWHRDNAPKHSVTEFSRKFDFYGPDLLRAYKRKFPDVFIQYGLMPAPQPAPKPKPQPKPKPVKDSPGGGSGSNSGSGGGSNSGGQKQQPTTTVQPVKAGGSKIGLVLLGLAASGTAYWYFMGDDKKKKKSN